MHGARLRQCEAGMQSEALRRCVHRNDEIEIAALAEHDERQISLPASGER